MRLTTRLPIVAGVVLSVAAPYLAVFSAQDGLRASRPTMTFHLRPVADSLDPEPSEQTPDERTATLRSRIVAAKALLDEEDYRTFFDDFVDPFWLARSAAGEEESVETFAERLLGEPRYTKFMAQRFGHVLTQSLKAEPRWLLNGRAASFMTDHNSHSAEFWVYFEGKRRISPET